MVPGSRVESIGITSEERLRISSNMDIETGMETRSRSNLLTIVANINTLGRKRMTALLRCRHRQRGIILLLVFVISARSRANPRRPPGVGFRLPFCRKAVPRIDSIQIKRVPVIRCRPLCCHRPALCSYFLKMNVASFRIRPKARINCFL